MRIPGQHEALQTMSNYGTELVGFVVLLALAASLCSGVLFMTSSGSPWAVDRARAVLLSAVVAWILAATSFYAVSYAGSVISSSDSNIPSFTQAYPVDFITLDLPRVQYVHLELPPKLDTGAYDTSKSLYVVATFTEDVMCNGDAPSLSDGGSIVSSATVEHLLRPDPSRRGGASSGGIEWVPGWCNLSDPYRGGPLFVREVRFTFPPGTLPTQLSHLEVTSRTVLRDRQNQDVQLLFRPIPISSP